MNMEYRRSAICHAAMLKAIALKNCKNVILFAIVLLFPYFLFLTYFNYYF